MNEPLPVEEGWLTTLEASKIYGCSVRQMAWYCRLGRVSGAIKTYKPIVHYRIPEVFEVLPPRSEMGLRLWNAKLWGIGPRQLRG